MKILHIAPTSFFSDRGCHIRILGEITALHNLGYVNILTTYHIGRNVGDAKIERIIHIPWYQNYQVGGTWQKLYLDILLFIKTVYVFIKEKPQIIHGHLHEGTLLGRMVSLFCSLNKTPVIFDVQGSLISELASYGLIKKNRFLKYLFSHVEKWICNLADHLVCSSDSIAEFLYFEMKIPSDKITVLQDGVFPNYFGNTNNGKIKESLKIPPDKKVIIYTGSLTESKGFDDFLNIIPEIIQIYEKVFFVIVGYPIEHSLKQAKEMQIMDHVFFAGKVDFFKLPDFLTIADVAVDPKIDLAGEGSGKIINYMGAGLPVVCFKNVNNRKFIGDNGFFAESGNWAQFSEQIIKALINESAARMAGKRNQVRAQQHFSWTLNVQRLESVYHKFLKIGER